MTKQRSVRDVRENIFNQPIAVRWKARLCEEAGGIRAGTMQLRLGESENAVIVHVKTRGSAMECDTEKMTGVKKHGPTPSIMSLEKKGMPAFAKKFLETVVCRLEQEWSRISRTLSRQGEYLVGSGQMVILPGEWGQNRTEACSAPYARIISTPMGGMNKRY